MVAEGGRERRLAEAHGRFEHDELLPRCSRVSLWNLRMEPYGKESASVIFPEAVYPQFGQKDGPFLGTLRRVSHSGQNLN